MLIVTGHVDDLDVRSFEMCFLLDDNSDHPDYICAVLTSELSHSRTHTSQKVTSDTRSTGLVFDTSKAPSVQFDASKLGILWLRMGLYVCPCGTHHISTHLPVSYIYVGRHAQFT
eukprot:Blabericola_migrator_1__5911@NODE_2991_length_2135_cov_25_341393_g1871_i0_p3_GENE_NODE_2991_length_2135_cov_25_341393_g1871_i0NODE_2991_length_2135_cov_25_341393_g1871_i0_p3_ORF_typecomplete_len115_score12_01_NODE_2991_length_2135_cov_25_341393_g1871_i011991543